MTKPSRLLAGVFAFVAFVVSFATLALMLIIGAALPGYSRAELDAGQYVQQFETLLASIAAIIAFSFAIFLYLLARHFLSWAVIFHAFFFIGLALLGYCLWAVLTLFPILGNPLLITDSSAHILQATFSGLLLCLFVIPVALFFLASAAFYDNNRHG